jgi:hypothetical protein
MSLSFGSSKKSTKTNQETDPWEPTIQPLEDLISRIGDYSGNVGATEGQQGAFDQLFANAAEGNPFKDQIKTLAGDLFGAENNSGTVEDAYKRITDQLGGVAAGDNLDVNENPYLQQLMQQVGDDIQNRTSAMFAGAGRDVTGNAQGQKAIAKGISEGTLPALFNQYNLERQNQSDAAKTLFGAGDTTAKSVQGLDTANFLDRLRGIEAGNAAIDADNYGANTTLALEQQLKQLPIEDLGRIEALLGPIAQLGMQGKAKSDSKGTSMGVGVSNLFGGLGSLLSDERTKENKQKVSELADGTPVYRYNYKADPTNTPQVGMMAQDVEKKTPEAVDEIGGVKFLDYEVALAAAAKRGKKKRG